MTEMKLKNLIYFISTNLFLLMMMPTFVEAKQATPDRLSTNEQMAKAVGKQIQEVLNVWIGIGTASMILSIIAGAALIILAGTNPKLVRSGKSLVLGSGITIALLLSTYVITELILRIFGMSMF
ncbi:hypothetical protein MZM54_00715 [[Brevibacterium] frigoritolerans]|nr:hypothetical protein [Peribacillus frigoritolerans]